MGIISEDLSFKLVEPPLSNQQKSISKRKLYANARSTVTSKTGETKKIDIDKHASEKEKQIIGEGTEHIEEQFCADSSKNLYF